MKNKIAIATLLVATLIYAKPLSLSNAFNKAIENSHEIKSLLYQLDSNKQKVVQEKAFWLPQVNFSASHSKTEFEVNHLYKRADYDYIEDSTDLRLTVSQAIYDPQTDARIELEEYKINFFLSKIEIQRENLAKKVSQIYFKILDSKNKIKLLKSKVSYNKFKLKAIQKKYELKLANKMDLLQIKVDINSLKIDLQKEKELIKLYHSNLKHLIGEFEESLPTIDLAKINSQKIAMMKKIISQKGKFLSNSQIKQVLISKELSKKEIKNSKTGHLPKVTLNASYTKFISEDITTDYENTKKIMLEFKIPLYQGGYVKSKIEASKLQYQASQEDLIAIKKEIEIEYDEQLLSFNSAVQSINLYKEAIESVRLYLDSISQGFSNGLKSSVDLAEAQNRVDEVEYKYRVNIQQMVQSYAKLLLLSNDFKNLNLIDNIL